MPSTGHERHDDTSSDEESDGEVVITNRRRSLGFRVAQTTQQAKQAVMSQLGAVVENRHVEEVAPVQVQEKTEAEKNALEARQKMLEAQQIAKAQQAAAIQAAAAKVAATKAPNQEAAQNQAESERKAAEARIAQARQQQEAALKAAQEKAKQAQQEALQRAQAAQKEAVARAKQQQEAQQKAQQEALARARQAQENAQKEALARAQKANGGPPQAAPKAVGGQVQQPNGGVKPAVQQQPQVQQPVAQANKGWKPAQPQAQNVQQQLPAKNVQQQPQGQQVQQPAQANRGWKPAQPQAQNVQQQPQAQQVQQPAATNKGWKPAQPQAQNVQQQPQAQQVQQPAATNKGWKPAQNVQQQPQVQQVQQQTQANKGLKPAQQNVQQQQPQAQNQKTFTPLEHEPSAGTGPKWSRAPQKVTVAGPQPAQAPVTQPVTPQGNSALKQTAKIQEQELAQEPHKMVAAIVAQKPHIQQSNVQDKFLERQEPVVEKASIQRGHLDGAKRWEADSAQREQSQNEMNREKGPAAVILQDDACWQTQKRVPIEIQKPQVGKITVPELNEKEVQRTIVAQPASYQKVKWNEFPEEEKVELGAAPKTRTQEWIPVNQEQSEIQKSLYRPSRISAVWPPPQDELIKEGHTPIVVKAGEDAAWIQQEQNGVLRQAVWGKTSKINRAWPPPEHELLQGDFSGPQHMPVVQWPPPECEEHEREQVEVLQTHIPAKRIDRQWPPAPPQYQVVETTELVDSTEEVAQNGQLPNQRAVHAN